jgi:hypothetical protein
MKKFIAIDTVHASVEVIGTEAEVLGYILSNYDPDIAKRQVIIYELGSKYSFDFSLKEESQ